MTVAELITALNELDEHSYVELPNGTLVSRIEILEEDATVVLH